MPKKNKKAIQILVLTDLLQSGTIDQDTYDIAAKKISGTDTGDPLDPVKHSAA